MVRWPGTALVRAILTNQQIAFQHMMTRREAERVAVAIAPRVRLDRRIRELRVKPGAQDRSVADTMVASTGESLHGPTGILGVKGRVAAGFHPPAGIEHVIAEHDILAWDVLL